MTLSTPGHRCYCCGDTGIVIDPRLIVDAFRSRLQEKQGAGYQPVAQDHLYLEKIQEEWENYDNQTGIPVLCNCCDAAAAFARAGGQELDLISRLRSGLTAQECKAIHTFLHSDWCRSIKAYQPISKRQSDLQHPIARV